MGLYANFDLICATYLSEFKWENLNVSRLKIRFIRKNWVDILRQPYVFDKLQNNKI